MLFDNEENKKTFFVWLLDQVDRNDDTGKLSKILSEEDNVPKSSKYSDWVKFIEENNFTSIDTFNEIWTEYIVKEAF